MNIFKKIDKRLLPMKIVMFGWFGAYACASPFMTIHMKELGLTVEEIALIYTLLPITQFLSTPIAGFISDRLGRYRNVLLLALVMTIIFSLALLYVPPINRPKSAPTVTLFCANNYNSIVIHDCDVDDRDTSKYSVEFNSCEVSNCDQSVIKSNGTIQMLLKLNEQSQVDSCQYKASFIHSNHYPSLPDCSQQTNGSFVNCSIKCFIHSPTSKVSPGTNHDNFQMTFFLYSFFRIVYNIFSSIGFTLVNASALALTETTDGMGEYGQTRMWGMLAMAIFSPLSGIFVDLISSSSLTNYAPAYHMHNTLALLTCIAVWFLDFEMEDAPTSYRETFNSFWNIIKSPPILLLLIVVFWLGTVWGFLESFLFWFMIELNSPTYLMGLTITIGSIVGIPFLYYARSIVTKFGHANILSMALFMYMVRCIGCSLLSDPWWIMPFEMLEIFTYHLMWVAAATYAVQLSPPGLLATIQGFIEGIHYGVGQGSGSLIGGSLISVFGNRRSLQIIGAISGILGLIYAALHFFWLRKHRVNTLQRRASVKSYSSQKAGRKTSSLSNPDVNGPNVTPSARGTIISNLDLNGTNRPSSLQMTTVPELNTNKSDVQETTYTLESRS